jgi:hypothetical protein
MKDFRNAKVTIANATDKVQSFVPYAQSFLYKLAPQTAIQFPTNSVAGIYYTKQTQNGVASQVIGEDDVTITPDYQVTGDDYLYVGGKVIGNLISGSILSLKIKNPLIASRDELPDGIILKVKHTEWGELDNDKRSFQQDGSFYFNSDFAPVDKFPINEVQINWGNGFETYKIDCTALNFIQPSGNYYNIVDDVKNGNLGGETIIAQGGTAHITLGADNGYVVPQTLTQDNIENATYNNDYLVDGQGFGSFTISNPTGDVLIAIECEEEQQVWYNIVFDGHDTAQISGDSTVLARGNAVVYITPDSGYVLHSDLEQNLIGKYVSGNFHTAQCTIDGGVATITIEDVDSNISIDITCEQPQPSQLIPFEENEAISQIVLTQDANSLYSELQSITSQGSETSILSIEMGGQSGDLLSSYYGIIDPEQESEPTHLILGMIGNGIMIDGAYQENVDLSTFNATWDYETKTITFAQPMFTFVSAYPGFNGTYIGSGIQN